MLDFFKTNKFKIITLIIALLFGMMLYSASSDGLANIPRNLLEMVTTPFQKAGAYISDAAGGFFDGIINYKDTIAENERLKAENAELNQKLVDYEKIKDENDQYKTMAGIKEIYSDFTVTMAFVISRDPADRFSSFMIDRGSLHGVKLNDPVMTPSGLVGIVTKVGPISSRVRTTLSPENDVGAIEIVSKELGVLSGDIELASQGLAKLSILSEETSIKEGDMIVTAGASGIYPKGIPIGKVVEVKTEAHGVTKYAKIQPLVDIEEISTVQVIIGFNGQGSELIDFFEDDKE